ncbi:ATP synthase subunit a 2 [Candidatus Methylobacter favarea]|uniref:ATP synthase subunit a n=1 Tax=Candidatus Methylobacter favarea TaxID=2707345 RepID=A0A8S0WQP2_9GAMM|nr:F0F1 ATP synthase subunit A [Candidatus Methylobacter favarea]CAA9891559.1 ATP synthase subunit a 2 [Candidatus Methylobacter favarea]
MENAYSFALGAVVISLSVITTWGIMLVLTLIAWLSTRSLKLFPGARQTVFESIVTAIDEAILAVAPEHGRQIMPFIASLWIFLTIANLIGLIPGLHSPTRDLSVTAALAVLVFFSVHWFGIKTQGLKRYLHHYLTPSPILLPFHIISEFTRTLALAIRLFGNMMSLEMAAMLILLVAGFLAPIPILMLHIIEALVQAYIFGMLALIYLAGAIQSQQLNPQE